MTSFLPFRLVVRLFFCTFAPFIIYDIMALIKSYRGMRPKWGKECYFSENATIVGDVTMGDECSVWFNAVVRGDVAPITIGDRTNVQDGSCIHVTHDTGPTHIGSDVTIGHNVTVHACTIHDGALIGMGSTLLDNCEVGEGSIVAAHEDSCRRDLGRCACEVPQTRPSRTNRQRQALRRLLKVLSRRGRVITQENYGSPLRLKLTQRR